MSNGNAGHKEVGHPGNARHPGDTPGRALMVASAGRMRRLRWDESPDILARVEQG